MKLRGTEAPGPHVLALQLCTACPQREQVPGRAPRPRGNRKGPPFSSPQPINLSVIKNRAANGVILELSTGRVDSGKIRCSQNAEPPEAAPKATGAGFGHRARVVHRFSLLRWLASRCRLRLRNRRSAWASEGAARCHELRDDICPPVASLAESVQPAFQRAAPLCRYCTASTPAPSPGLA